MPIRSSAIVAVLLLAGCAQAPGGNPGGNASGVPATIVTPTVTATGTDALTSNIWSVESVNGQTLGADVTITVRFTADGKVSGSGGCNPYSGKYTSDGASLKFADVTIGAAACAGDVGTSEDAFAAAIQAAQSFKVANNRLVVQGEGGKAVLSLSAQRQILAGTSWTVTSYDNATGAPAGVLDEPDVTVSFGTDGKVSGNTGCNTFDGAFISGDGTVKLGPLVATKSVCETPAGLMAQEARVLADLDAAATFAITGDELQLTGANGVAVLQLAQS